MLNLMEGFDFSTLEFNSVDHLHLVTELKKIAYADRAAYYADPAFGPLRPRARAWVVGRPLTRTTRKPGSRGRNEASPALVPAANIPTERLLSKDYADERRTLVDMERAADRVDAGQLREGDTIYLTTADKDGNMVSLIQSNYRGMGAGVRSVAGEPVRALAAAPAARRLRGDRAH